MAIAKAIAIFYLILIGYALTDVYCVGTEYAKKTVKSLEIGT